jgi:hypothetical protein
MKYIYNPVTGTLDDVETPNLGEKYFASAETDALKDMMNEQFGPGTIKYGSEIDQPEMKTPQAVFEFSQRNPAADGGMMRKNFADNPLKNFEIFNIDNIPEGYVPATDFSKKLGIEYDTLKTIKSRNSPPYQRLIEYIGEPIRVKTDRLPGGGGSNSTDYFNIADLTPEVIEAYKTKQPYPDRGGKGVKVLSDKNLKQKFIKAYNDGYGGRDIMSVIDPDNKLNVNQEKYGSATLTELLNSEQVKPRKEGFISKGQELYFEKNRIPIDKQIVKVNSFYKPGMSIEKVTQKLFPNFSPIVESDSFNVRQEKTNQLKEASNRIVDYKAWLKGDRPSSSILDELTLPNNKKQIIKYIEASTDSTFGKFASTQERRYKYYQLDKLNNKPMGYYDGLNKKIYADFKRLGLNYQIEHGGSLSQSLKKKIPWVSKFVTFMKPKYNRQKIPLDMDTGILKAYDVLEDKKLSVEEKKNHPDVKKHNKAAKEFMQKTGTKIPVISFNEKDVNKIIEREDVDKQTKTQVKNTFDKNGWTLINPGDQIEEVVKIVKDADKLPSNRKQLIVSGFRNKIANFFQNAPVPKGVKLPINATAAALDFAIFNGLMGMPAPEAMLGSSQWLLKNPEAAEKIGKSINLVIEGKMTVDSFFNKNSEELGGVFKDLVGIDMPDAYSKDDEVGDQRLQEMDAAMAVPDLKKMPSTDMDETTAAPLYDFATGGRVNFDDGSPKPQLDGNDFLNELEFKFNNIDNVTLDDTPITFDDSKSSIAQVADLANPKNIPYYADLGVRSLLRIGEFGTRILPATGTLISDVLQKPMFKIKSSYAREDDNEILDYGETPENNNVKFVGGPIFKNFLKNITPTSTEKLVGLDTLINEEKKKMIERGSSSLPVKVAETAALGGELIAPIFPGLKLLRAYAKSKNLPANDDTKQLLEQDVDMVLESNGMDRRQFLQITGTGGAVVLAKMLGFGDEFATATKVAEKATAEAVSTYPPPYFFKLVEKIKNMGDDITEKAATQEREIVKSYKDYEMTEDLATGEIVIRKRNEGVFYDQDGIISDEYIVYKPGQADELTKGKTPPAQYDEYTVKPDGEGKLTDSEDGLDSIEEILEEVGDPDSLTLKR